MLIHLDELEFITAYYNDPVKQVSHIAYDSRQAIKDSVFICLQGENSDGHDYIEEAITNGATVVIGTDKEQIEEAALRHPHCSFATVADDREVLAQFAISFYGQPDRKIRTIGVTGTNGKTTVAAFVKSLLTQCGIRTGSIGTNGIYSSQEEIVYKKSTPTTPEASDLHAIFNELVKKQDEAVVMEVSSIAIDQKRVAGIQFDTAIHTNISTEHLEYHKTFAHYKEAKMKLFDQAHTAVVNIDDEMGRELTARFKGDLITYSLDRHSGADLIADNCHVSEEGTMFELIVGGQSYLVNSSVYGNYNVHNLLSAIGTALHHGLELDQVIPVLKNIENPKGRFQVIEEYGGRKIIIDYAHTPVALNSLLAEAKKLPHNKLIAMIAGIGIRDFNKMPKMAETAEGQADQIVVTVDHPGDHDPKKVVDQVMTGFKKPYDQSILTSLTRKEGVLKALSQSEEGDLILLTSGCINGAQIVKGEYIPHSDEDLIRDYFNRLEKTKRPGIEQCK
ncbi:UDP-N-acetylmuramoyl-L-alanyl-D-glutamate--2,6-diaminopimelate ligase [Jeotgalibacillus haloalkalitolerans]|uniref:UDP-N-acetylmuramyl-tripeptide synthetase n=1 Tax=Jeotgalibacillus haloalkalitolerans TaxID=3104292 RepID=A0ABU5KQ55_9BACL|nr:UDP-N-acetylmuramoyl-L-alanyl-D-glutamate--2,6-diaminopimelate ligase [Jeotgalibacillus sp. HH7-29]MDZ5713282.1 UDP-N-acetylmuramoyl-L-alanyl-D-glutamate--2,6-diaminopimelate ligase [Jeotgalibacillus sp. HH7-29]